MNLSSKEWKVYSKSFKFLLDNGREFSTNYIKRCILSGNTVKLALTYEKKAFKGMNHKYLCEYESLFGRVAEGADYINIPMYTDGTVRIPAWYLSDGISVNPLSQSAKSQERIHNLKQGAWGILELNRSLLLCPEFGAYAFPINKEVSEDKRSWSYRVSDLSNEALDFLTFKDCSKLDLGNLSNGVMQAVINLSGVFKGSFIVLTKFDLKHLSLKADGKLYYVYEGGSEFYIQRYMYKIHDYLSKYKNVNVSSIGFMSVPKYRCRAFAIKELNETYRVFIY